MIRPYLTLSEIAAAIAVSPAWLRRHAGELARDHGFPAPAPGMGRRYDAGWLADWQAAGSPGLPRYDHPPCPPAIAARNIQILVDEAIADAPRRYAERAAHFAARAARSRRRRALRLR